MISKIGFNNFKAFENETILLKPITILVGPNNSGKSSIISSLRLLSQTLGSSDTTVPLLLNGNMGDFGTYKDIVFNNSVKRHMSLSLEVDSTQFSRRSSKTIKNVSIILKYAYRRIRREFILKGIQLNINDKSAIITSYSEDSGKQIIQEISGISTKSSLRSSISAGLRMQNFLPNYIPSFRYRNMKLRGKSTDIIFRFENYIGVEEYSHLLNQARRILSTSILDVEYLGAMRDAPLRTYLFTGEKRKRIGFIGENTTNILAMDSLRGGGRKRNILNAVVSWLKQAELASDLKINKLSDRHFEIRMQHPITKEVQNFADVGYGNSQVLPVLVGGLNLEKYSLYMVEQPEIHLHPRAQSELGDFFLDLYDRKIQTIIETHSEHLILRLQQHVANGKIPVDDILFYYVYAQGDQKKVVPLRINNYGYFVDEWPEGFFPEKLEEAKKLARIRFKKES